MVALKMATAVMVSKIRPKDLGNPKMAAALPDGDTRVITLGTIIGKASGVKKFVDQQDETKVSYALRGSFEAQPANTDANGNPIDEKFRKPVMRSGICWLPGGLHEQIVHAVTGGDPTTKIPNVVGFRVAIGVQWASNRAGYEYSNRLETDIPDQADPLADLRGDAPAQIIDGTAQEVDAATEAAAAESASQSGDEEETSTRGRRRR